MYSFGSPFELRIHRGVQPKVDEVWGLRREQLSGGGTGYSLPLEATVCPGKYISLSLSILFSSLLLFFF